jgi:hypothetical protein
MRARAGDDERRVKTSARGVPVGLQSTRDGDDVRSLRYLLKSLLRRSGWRALSIEEERGTPVKHEREVA